jgi:hypothetical protein
MINLGFRYRVALMATLLSLCTLFVVIWLIQARLQEIEERQALTELCLQARRMALLVRTVAPVENIESSSILRLKIDSTQGYLFDWKNVQSGKILRSNAWPTDLDQSKLKWGLVPATRDDELMTAKGQVTSVECHKAIFTTHDEYRNGNWLAARAITADGYGFAAINVRSIIQSTWTTITEPVAAIVAPIALILSLFSAWLLSLYVMAPIRKLGAAMSQVSSGLRIDPLPLKDLVPEFQQLIASYNDMVVRLKNNFEQVSRFSADAAHELKTPLTILRGQIEQALINPEKLDSEALLLELQSQVSNLSAITRKLLLLSQADAGHLVLDKKPVDWTALLNASLDDSSILVKHQKISSAIDSKLQVIGDEVMLRQLCSNLLNNAFLHGLSSGRVEISSHLINGGIETLVINDSDFISQAERKLFFDRFYRRDEVRQGGASGSGLGLSLAREIAKAHSGELTLQPSDERVVVLRLWLPNASSLAS